jgi:hypothetical protein
VVQNVVINMALVRSIPNPHDLATAAPKLTGPADLSQFVPGMSLGISDGIAGISIVQLNLKMDMLAVDRKNQHLATGGLESIPKSNSGGGPKLAGEDDLGISHRFPGMTMP